MSASILQSLDVLFVDVGNTLIHPTRSVSEVYVGEARRDGIVLCEDTLSKGFVELFSAKKMDARRKGQLAYGTTEESAKGFWWGLFVELLQQQGVSEAKAAPVFDRIYTHFNTVEAWTIYPDADRLLDRCAKASLPVVLVSNWDARLPYVVHACGITPRVQATVGSFEVGIEKPDPRIFDFAFEAAGVSRQTAKTLHVGDSVTEDMPAAKGAGVPCLIIDRSTSASPADTIASLDEL